MLCKLSNAVLTNLKIDYFAFYKDLQNEISSKMIEVFSKINPKYLTIFNFNKDLNELNSLFSSNLINIKVWNDSCRNKIFKLVFIHSTILICNSDSSKNIYLKWKTFTLLIWEEEFKNIILMKSNQSNCKDSNYLFFPFSSVNELELLDKNTETYWNEFEKRLANLYLKTDSNGFLVPLNTLYQTDLYFEEGFVESFKSNQIVASEIWTAKKINWEVHLVDELLEIKQLIPSNFSRIKYSIYKWDSQPSLRIADIDSMNIASFTGCVFSLIRWRLKLYSILILKMALNKFIHKFYVKIDEHNSQDCFPVLLENDSIVFL